jgi:hypothetical protein
LLSAGTVKNIIKKSAIGSKAANGNCVDKNAGTDKKQAQDEGQNEDNGIQKEWGRPSIEPSEPSHDNQEDSSIQVPESIYRAYGDTWACKNPGCKTKGDKWFMIKHPQHCRAGQLIKQNREVTKE